MISEINRERHAFAFKIADGKFNPFREKLGRLSIAGAAVVIAGILFYNIAKLRR